MEGVKVYTFISLMHTCMQCVLGQVWSLYRRDWSCKLDGSVAILTPHLIFFFRLDKLSFSQVMNLFLAVTFSFFLEYCFLMYMKL